MSMATELTTNFLHEALTESYSGQATLDDGLDGMDAENADAYAHAVRITTMNPAPLLPSNDAPSCPAYFVGERR